MISVEDFYSQRNNKEIVDRVQNHELPDELNTVLEEYERIIGERETYLWKWLHVLFPKFTLTCVPARDMQQIGKAKLLASVFIVLLDDLAPLRNTVFKAQTMVRIGNWLSTWEREVREGDFNSGVVVYALENDIVSRQDLYELRRDPAKEDIEQIVRAVKRSKFKEHFFARWQENYAEIEGLESEMASVDLCQFLNGIRKVTRYQMASRGLK